MKLKLVLFSLSILILSCSSELDEPTMIENSNTLNPKIERVIALANSAAERLFPPQTRGDSRCATVSGIKPVCSAMSRGDNDTLLYVVNYEDNKGFAVISGGRNSQPVLAVVPSGSYDPEIGTDNPGFNLFMEAATQNALADTTKKKDFELNPDYPININGKYQKTTETVVTHYGPAIRLDYNQKWGQKDIYGAYCSNGYSGCVPLTIATIVAYMRYHYNLDSRFYYTFPEADVPYDDIIWAEILRHKSSFDYYSDGSTINHICWAADRDASHKTIGRICRQIGYEGNATYNVGSTSMSSALAPALLRRYLPEFIISELKEFKAFSFMQSIDKGVVYLRADKKSGGSGHAWLTDGYEYIKTEVKKYEADEPASGLNYAWKLVSTTYKEDMLNYMRWGWNGEFDGWYAGTELDPTGKKNPYVGLQCVSVCGENYY